MSSAFLISIGNPVSVRTTPPTDSCLCLIFYQMGRGRLEKVADLREFSARKRACRREPQDAPCTLPEYFSDLSGQTLKGEWLLKECGSLLDGTVADNRIFGVARQVQDFRRRTRMD